MPLTNRTTIDIHIEGLAICYRKGNLWKVLLPFDLCHQIVFSHWRAGNSATKVGPQAVSNGLIRITSPAEAAPRTFQSNHFNSEVYDFTAPATLPYQTHELITVRDDWPIRTVLMEIENAFFSVIDYVDVLSPNESIVLHGENPGTTIPDRTLTTIARAVKATVVLPPGKVLKVESTNMASPLEFKDGGFYTLRFNNDCEDLRSGRNDMFLYYENTIVALRGGQRVPDERFWVGEVGTRNERFSNTMSTERFDLEGMSLTRPRFGKDNTDNGTGPEWGGPALDEGKPCMGGQCSQNGLLP